MRSTKLFSFITSILHHVSFSLNEPPSSSATKIKTQLHKAGSKLRTLQPLRRPRNSLHFMKPNGSLPHSKHHTTLPCPVSDEASPHFIHFITNLPNTLRFPKWLPPFTFYHQTAVSISIRSLACHMPCQSCPP